MITYINISEGLIIMKTIVVFYSLEGNTELAAKAIAEELGADLLPLLPVKAYPTGKVSKLVWGGKAAVMAEKPKLQPYTFNSADYDRIIFGSPVWASSFAPPLRTFIRDNDLSGKKFAAFLCETAGGDEKAFLKLKSELGIDSFDAQLTLLDPKFKPDPANTAKIKEFCDKLK